MSKRERLRNSEGHASTPIGVALDLLAADKGDKK